MKQSKRTGVLTTTLLKCTSKVYKQMVTCGIASKVDGKAHVDKSGNIIEFEANGYGLPT